MKIKKLIFIAFLVFLLGCTDEKKLKIEKPNIDFKVLEVNYNTPWPNVKPTYDRAGAGRAELRVVVPQNITRVELGEINNLLKTQYSDFLKYDKVLAIHYYNEEWCATKAFDNQLDALFDKEMDILLEKGKIPHMDNAPLELKELEHKATKCFIALFQKNKGQREKLLFYEI